MLDAYQIGLRMAPNVISEPSGELAHRQPAGFALLPQNDGVRCWNLTRLPETISCATAQVEKKHVHED